MFSSKARSVAGTMWSWLSLVPWVTALSAVAHAAPVADALARPALKVREPSRTVLLGAASCGNRLLAVGERGVIVSSDDAGKSWKQAQVPVSVTLTAVRCIDAQMAYAVGHGATVLASTDGGQTWTARLDGKRAAHLVQQAAQSSSDPRAQQDAARLVEEGPDKPLLDLHFFDAKRGLVVGAYGLAFATEDGGQSWTSWIHRLPNPKGSHLYSLRAQGDSVVVAGEQGLVLRSNDGGRQFQRLQLPYQGSFFTAELPAPNEIVVAGLRGNIWRSTDAGASWAQVPSPMPVSVIASAQLPSGQLLLANQGGLILQLSGANLVPLKTPTLPPLNALQPSASGGMVALSIQGAIALPVPDARP